jgi:predicted phosphodiesterase
MVDLVLQPPVLVFGGPYSNLRAVAALRARADELGIQPSSTICTGDVVAYCAEPEETTQAVRDWGCHVIAGNCEEQLAAAAEDCACGFEAGTECDLLAKGWYPFANARLSPASRAWMAGLPTTLTFTLAGVCFRVVHGGVATINRFVFASERDVIAQELEHACIGREPVSAVVISGHAGVPFARRIGARVWFNPGVIGMPANDGTADVWYGLVRFDSRNSAVTLSTHRLNYDHTAAAATMRRHGHANGYARTLVTGLWPSLDVLPPAERAATGKRLRQIALRIAAKPQAEKAVVGGQASVPGAGSRQADATPRR